MEFNVVKVSESQANELFPPKIRGIATEGQTFVAWDETNLAALALVTASDTFQDEYVLHYLAPRPGYGVAEVEALLGFVEDICKKLGIDALVCSLSGNFDELMDIHTLLKGRKYSPTVLNGHRLIYQKTYLEQSPFFAQISKVEPLLKYVRTYHELDKKQIGKLSSLIKRTGKSSGMITPDPVFGRFFVENGEITGMLDMREISPRVLFLSDIFTLSTPNSKFALPAMLASSLLAAKKHMDEETILIIQTYSDNLYGSFKSVFGEAYSEEMIFEYIKVL